MLKSMTVINYIGDKLTINLTEAFPEHGLIIKSISGLGPAHATINTSEFSSEDGGVYNSSRLEKRTITLDLLFSDYPDIETARQNTYKYFPIKRKVNLQFLTDNRYCECAGYVESNEPDIFSKEEGNTISIVCPDPYFYALNDSPHVTNFSDVTPLFKFAFENSSLTEDTIVISELNQVKDRIIPYTGDIEVGIIMVAHVYDETGDITVYNFFSKEYMFISNDKIGSLTGSRLKTGDELIISTVHGDRYARLLRDGLYTNVLNAVDRNSNWMQLYKGDNVFAFSTSDDVDENISFVIQNRVLYEGI